MNFSKMFHMKAAKIKQKENQNYLDKEFFCHKNNFFLTKHFRKSNFVV